MNEDVTPAQEIDEQELDAQAGGISVPEGVVKPDQGDRASRGSTAPVPPHCGAEPRQVMLRRR